MLQNIFNLDGKVVVITGALGLLGKKHAEAVAAYGGTPVLLDLFENEVEEFSKELHYKYGVDASGFAVDITNESKIELSVNTIVERYGKIDALVNNAAHNPDKPAVENNAEKNSSRLENFSLDVWNQDIEVGLTGAFLCAKYYGYQISKNLEGGSIINISSDLGLIAPDQKLYMHEGLLEEQQPVKPVSYSVVKAGIIGLTRYLSTYWSDKNVRCNAMCLGGVENNLPDNFMKKVVTKIPMNRLAKSNEYQGSLVWMLSDASSYLNGAIIPIEGGRTAW
ncbi:MAG: SDR family oxidoreductase [Lentimicrobiaceae bacterium]|jgi:NAD(P)-dependent dehydrogenase (short-subunit alcohol dehydrogenase family)|nr:SDR family oxidoreductase [Lentimicrobiaceae bacterium]